MISWSEKNGHKVIDWEDIVYRFKLEYDGYDDVKRAEYECLVMDWDTCAVGQTDHRIDRDKNGEPVDEILSTLGVRFGYLFSIGDWGKCLSILKQINERVKEL